MQHVSRQHLNFEIPFSQDFFPILFRCLETEQLFVDPMFPPCESSLYTTKSSSGITWIRASELVSDPQFFVGGASRFDIKQGILIISINCIFFFLHNMIFLRILFLLQLLHSYWNYCVFNVYCNCYIFIAIIAFLLR